MVSIALISSKIQLSVNLKITFLRDVHVWIAGHILPLDLKLGNATSSELMNAFPGFIH